MRTSGPETDPRSATGHCEVASWCTGSFVLFSPAEVHTHHLPVHTTQTLPSSNGGYSCCPALRNMRGFCVARELHYLFAGPQSYLFLRPQLGPV